MSVLGTHHMINYTFKFLGDLFIVHTVIETKDADVYISTNEIGPLRFREAWTWDLDSVLTICIKSLVIFLKSSI